MSPLIGDGDSSFDLRFSGRLGKKAVGEVLGVTPLPLPLLLSEPFVEFVMPPPTWFTPPVAIMPDEVLDVVRPPFVDPFRSFECT